MLLFLVMDPAEDGKALEDQWEKWLTNDFSLSEYEDEDLSELTEMTEQRREQEDDDADDDDVTLWLANDHAGREREGCVRSTSLELIDAEEIEEEGEEREVEEGGGGLVQAAERRHRLEKGEEEEEEEQGEQEEGGRKLSPLKGGSTCAVMDKYRPKRPTTLALFPQLPQAGTQDSINNNSLGKKDSWKDSRSSSPHITGDRAAQDIKPKAEDKVRLCSRRPAPKPPLVNGANSRANTHSAAGDTRARPRERQPSGATNTARSQRTAPAAGRGRGAGRAATAMRERNSADVRGKDAAMAAKEERKGGRLCEGKDKDKPQSHQRPRETSTMKSNGNDTKGKVCTKGDNRGGKVKLNNALSNQEVYLTAMVVPRTPVAPRNKDKTQEQGQNHDRSQENPPALSRSSSEGGSNRMSLSSDTEGPPPGPLNPSLTHRTNPDIREEEGEGAPSPCLNIQDHPKHCPQAPDATKTERSESEVEPGGGQGDRKSKADSGTWLTQGDPAAAAAAAAAAATAAAAQTVPKSEASAGLNYDSVKYTLVVDEHAQLELGSLKDCLHVYPQHNEDSDAETVYQSANEEEDPEYKEERKKKEEAKKQESQREEEKKRRDEEEKRKRREEDLKRRREEEVKRRREVVARVWKHSKVASDAASEEEESTGGKALAPTSRKFLNLFANESSNYSATGAGSFGVFSCVLDGVEREQSHRAAYRFVPRHADELHLETDDPVLILKQSEDLWCQGYNMRSGATGIFPAFYAVKVAKENSRVQTDGWIEQFMVRFLGSVQVPIHKGNDVLCAAMQKVAYNRRLAGQPPASCVLEVSVRGVKISVQDQCHSAHRGDQCFHFFQLKNISFCGCHPKHSKYFGFITKHPDQQRFACHVMMAEKTLHPLAESVGKAFQQYYKEHIGYSCPTEDIFLE